MPPYKSAQIANIKEKHFKKESFQLTNVFPIYKKICIQDLYEMN